LKRSSRNINLIFILAVFLLPAIILISPAKAQIPTAQPLVKAVLFWMEGCPHCHTILNEVLPPLQEKYGSQLEIRLLEVVTTEDIELLYVLIGSKQVPDELPGFIEQYLSQGGTDWPQGLAPEPVEEAPAGTPQDGGSIEAVVQAILFTTPDCDDCQLEIGTSLTPMKAKYGAQFEYRTIDIVTSDDVEYLYRVAELYRIAREDVDLPLIIIGEQLLIGEQMVDELPGLVESYLAAGGVAYQVLSDKFEAEPSPPPPSNHSNGFTLAIVIMMGMAAALVYALVAFVVGKAFALPATKTRWLFPLLALVGLGVALYLAYVETQSVSAICGPVGDCNAVQSSPYARLFGFLPVGVLGALGYLAMLGLWAWTRTRHDWLARYAPLALFAITFFGTIFSLYLTYLEPFVIKAVCIWCLTSAVIITFLLLISLAPALEIFSSPDEEM